MAVQALFEETLDEAGVVLWLVALNPEPLKIIRGAPLGAVMTDDTALPYQGEDYERILVRALLALALLGVTLLWTVRRCALR